MRNGTEVLFVIALVVVIAAGGVYLYKSSNVGCIDYFFGKACGVNVLK